MITASPRNSFFCLMFNDGPVNPTPAHRHPSQNPPDPQAPPRQPGRAGPAPHGTTTVPSSRQHVPGRARQGGRGRGGGGGGSHRLVMRQGAAHIASLRSTSGQRSIIRTRTRSPSMHCTSRRRVPPSGQGSPQTAGIPSGKAYGRGGSGASTGGAGRIVTSGGGSEFGSCGGVVRARASASSRARRVRSSPTSGSSRHTQPTVHGQSPPSTQGGHIVSSRAKCRGGQGMGAPHDVTTRQSSAEAATASRLAVSLTLRPAR